MKRGQSALEYLVTYGWAILAIVIIAAVLWYTGVFNPAKFRGGQECGGFGKFTCSDFLLLSTASGGPLVNVSLGNSVGRQITGVSGTIYVSGQATTALTASKSDWAPNEVVKLSAAALPAGVSDQSGFAYDVLVTITYTDSQSSLQHTDTGGFLRGKVE